MNRYAKALKIVNPKKSILEDKPLLAVKIVKGEYYSRPVMEKEIKEYVKKTFKKSNQYRYRKDNWLENLVEEKQIEFDRKEIEKEIKLRRLYEQMTTANMMTTLIQGEGETDIESVDGSVAASYSPLSGESSAFDNTAITSNGTGSGEDGGFDVGQDYLAFNGVGSPRYAALDAIDSTEVDTIVITAIRGNDTNGGEDPDAADEDLTVWYQIGDATPVKIGIIIPVGSDDSGLKNWSLTIPAAAQNAATKFILRQETHHGAGYDNYGVTDIKFQRRAPMNVVVSLDSPEASAFIRTGGGGTTEKDKKKKVQDILDGSDAYLENQFGEDFPGTSPREVGQEEPQPGIGKFEPEVIDYETWKNELENSDDPEAKKILKGDPKKTFNAFVDDNPELAAQSVLNDLLKGKSVKDQLSHLPQEVQDIIISQATESLLLDLSQGASLESVKDQLSQLPQETQDMITSHPLYMTDERIEEIVKDDKMFGDTMQSMWEKDEKLFNSAIDEVNEYPEHQKLNELQNTVYGFKGKDDEGYVPFTWKYSDGSTEDRSHLVLSNMSPLLYDRWAPYHELALKYYGTSDYEGSRYQTQTNVPNDYVFNHGYWYKDPVDASNEHDMPIGAPGSALRKISQPFLDAYKVHYDYDEKWGDYIKAGAQKYKDGPKFDGGEVNDPGWEKWQKIEKEAFDLWSKYREEEKKLTPQRQRMEKEIENLNKKLEAEYDKKREQIEKEMEPLMSLLHRDFIKLFTLQHFENKYGYKVPSDDSKPWSMDIQRSKDLGGSAGEIAGVDAATAASVAAQTQRDKDKGNKGGNISGSNLTAAKEQELLQLAKMIDRKGTDVAAVGAAAVGLSMMVPQVKLWIAAGLSYAMIMSRIMSQSGSSSNPLSASGDIDWAHSDSKERGLQRTPEGEMRHRQRTEAQEADKALQDAIDQHGEDSDEAREARQARNDMLARHKKERKGGGIKKDDSGKGKEGHQNPSRGSDDTWYGEQTTRKGRYLSDSKTFKKNLDAVEPKEHKRSGMRIKSPKQFFNPADVKPEFPKDPPPEMINGYHPKLADGQEIANRFNKLDPQSAEAMPKTGNPHIDAKVEKAKNNPDKDGPAHRQNVFAKIKKARG